MMDKPIDTELIERASGGDRRAFELLAKRHYTLVYRAAYKFTGSREDAEDVAQEVFMKLGRAIYHFRGDSSFTTWLYRITVNVVRDFQRGEARKRTREGAYIEEKRYEELGAVRDDNPVSAARLYREVKGLPVKLIDAVILVYSEGLSHGEAAVTLGCAEATVSWRLFQARKKLKKIFAREVR